MRSSGKKWTSSEDQILRANARKHDWQWPGWAEVLPDRNIKAVRNRARLIGIVKEETPVFCVRDTILLMHVRGVAPSRIDEAVGTAPGYANKVIARAWRLEKEGLA